MTYPFEDKEIDLPADPQFGESRDIDAADWDDVNGAANWLHARRGGRVGGFYIPARNEGSSVNVDGDEGTTFSSGDFFFSNASNTRTRAEFFQPRRSQPWHDDHDDGSAVAYSIISTLANVKVNAGRAQARVVFGSFDPSNQRQDSSTQDGLRTAWTSTGSRHTVLGVAILKHHVDVPIWGYEQFRVETSDDDADFWWVAVRETEQLWPGMWMDNDSPADSTARMLGAPWVGMENDNNDISIWEGDAAYTGFAPQGQVTLNKGAINLGAASYDELSAASFREGSYCVSQYPDALSGEGVWAAVSVKRDQDHSRASILGKFNESGAVVELFEDNGIIKVGLNTSDGSFVVSGSSSIGIWEDWSLYWTVGGELTLYKNGSEVDRTSTSGTLQVGEGRYSLAARPDGSDPMTGDLALPILVDDSLDLIQTERALGWRAARTNLCSIVDVT